MNKDKEIEAYLRGELDGAERLKYEIAGELGILDRVLKDGWKSLSAKETGRIGGLMTRRRKTEALAPVITGTRVFQGRLEVQHHPLLNPPQNYCTAKMRTTRLISCQNGVCGSGKSKRQYRVEHLMMR